MNCEIDGQLAQTQPPHSTRRIILSANETTRRKSGQQRHPERVLRKFPSMQRNNTPFTYRLIFVA